MVCMKNFLDHKSKWLWNIQIPVHLFQKIKLLALTQFPLVKMEFD